MLAQEATSTAGKRRAKEREMEDKLTYLVGNAQIFV
jgi:hypothetical protein